MKRVYEFDFIRALATLLIILTHFNALFIYNVYRPNMAVGCINAFGTYIGNIGASLFLIISSGALMYKYKDKKLSLKEFYINRFKKIFPLFWLSYFIILSISLLLYGSVYINRIGVPKYNFVYSILGIDSYLSCFGIKTFYIVGEWFLGFILIFYIVFPLLLFLVKRFPKSTFVVSTVIYIASLFIFKDYQYSAIILPIRLLELVFGMYFILYKNRINLKVVLPFVIFLIVQHVFQFSINQNILTSVVGISLFVILYYIGGYIKKCSILTRLTTMITTISYPSFIIHHWLIILMVSKIDLYSINKFTTYIIFICCLLTIIICSYLLLGIYNYTRKILSK